MDGTEVAPSFVTRLVTTVHQRTQHFLDVSTPHVVPRWAVAAGSLVLFMLRIIFAQGWYIVAYALGIYLLNLFIAFLTPAMDPSIAQTEDDDETSDQLPTKSNDEFRPFMRRLPEFKFWLSAQRAIVLGILATFFKAFDVPVFWPILVLYFIILFVISMKKQIAHMIKYRYIPISFGKPKHRGKEDSGKVIRQ